MDLLEQEYRARRPLSSARHDAAREYFAAEGATHFTRVGTPFRPYVSHALGARKWDVDGNEYLDYVMGHGALILGHSHPAVVDAIQRQAALGLHYGDNHPLEVAWAERIRALVPAAERIEFFASGQEADMMAVRVARVATGRKRLLRFQHNYHGWADELVADGAPGALDDWVTTIAANDLDLVEQQLAGREYAAVLIEGGGGRLSGRIPTSVQFFQALPSLAAKYGTVLILDEVVTGFREAPGGWQSVVGITPDLTTMGKAASGGLPSGLLLGRADLMAHLSPASAPGNKVVAHGGTWNAVPLTCAAGIAACDLYVDGEPQRIANAMAALLREQANAMFRRRGFSARLYGRSVTHIYLGPIDRDTDGTAPPTADLAALLNPAVRPLHQRVDLHLLHRGVASLRGEAFVLSAAHTAADITLTVDALEESVAAVEARG